MMKKTDTSTCAPSIFFFAGGYVGVGTRKRGKSKRFLSQDTPLLDSIYYLSTSQSIFYILLSTTGENGNLHIIFLKLPSSLDSDFLFDGKVG